MFEAEKQSPAAGGILDETRAAVRKLMESSKQKGFEVGYSAGLEQGRAEGRRRAAEEAQPALRELERLGCGLEELYAQEEPEPERKILELARRLAELALAADDEAYLALFAKAARHFGRAAEATLHAGGRGGALARENPERFRRLLDGLERFEVVAEGGNGRCVLETPEGSVDASLETQFKRALAILNPQDGAA